MFWERLFPVTCTLEHVSTCRSVSRSWERKKTNVRELLSPRVSKKVNRRQKSDVLWSWTGNKFVFCWSTFCMRVCVLKSALRFNCRSRLSVEGGKVFICVLKARLADKISGQDEFWNNEKFKFCFINFICVVHLKVGWGSFRILSNRKRDW